MTSIFQDGALHPGRDANDAWWITVRRPEDWGSDPRPPGDYGTRYDASRMVLELSPHALALGTPPPAEVTGPDGTRYVVDTYNDRLLRQRRCDSELMPLPGVGGRGWSTGRFDQPIGLALDDHGWVYVVEAGNHRVQIIDPDSPGGARVVAVLGGVDAWGRPCAGDIGGSLRDPVAVAVGISRIYVAMKSGSVQSYDRQFRPGPRFLANRPGAAAPTIIGVATAGDDLLVVADAGWSRLSRFRCSGSFVDEIGIDQAPPSLADELALARFALEGTRVIGPIDGGFDRLAWHKIVVDAELPPGTAVEVQTWAADAIERPPPLPAIIPALPASPRWAPIEPVAIPIDGESTGETARPVLSDTTLWEQWQHAPFLRGAAWKHPLAGTGPNATSSFPVPVEIARRLRADDEIELQRVTAPPIVHRFIAAVSAWELSVIASGDRTPVYAAGTKIVLVERDGHPLDEAVIHELTAGETIDLTSITVEGGGADVLVPHAVAALLYRGDVIEIRSATKTARVAIESMSSTPATITLTSAVPSDYRTSTLRLVEAVGRLVVRSSAGWGRGFAPGSKLSVARIGLSGEIINDPHVVVWSDATTQTVWLTTLVDPAWISISPAEQPIATDRGRYLWIKLRLIGARQRASDTAARATPIVRSLRAVAPRLSYLSYLPAVFSRRDEADPSGALFLERFLALFEGRLTRIEGRYEAIAYLLNPSAADDDWLNFVASWFALVLDPSWPRVRRAKLLSQIFELYRIRGTPEGIRRFIEAYTGHEPQLIEGFQVRPRVGITLGCEGVLGCAPLAGLDTNAAASEELLASYAHRFTLVTYVDDDCELDVAERSLRALVEAIKPAHTDVDLRIAVPHGRIGMETTIGIDFILGEDRRPLSPLGGASAAGTPSPVLGVDAVLSPSLGSSALAESSPPLIGGFSIG
jgi:phage tail-like protein